MRVHAALVAVAVLVLSACVAQEMEVDPSPGSQGSIEYITVGTSETLAPSLDFPPGLVYARPETRVMWEGEGPRLVAGQPILLQIYGESLIDGTTLLNTFDGLPQAYLLAPELLGKDLHEALLGARVGGRILHVAPADAEVEGEVPLALVVDVLPMSATGNEMNAPEGMPLVRRAADGEPVVAIPIGADPPLVVQTATLIQGQGPQVRAGSHIMVQYTGVRWEDGEEFISTWDPSTAPFTTVIGEGRVIAGWEEGLLDRTGGSQVLLVVPPMFGYPEHGTTVFVVDILHVWNPEE